MQISFFILKNETLNKQVTKKANVVLDVIVCMKNRLKFLTGPHKVYLPYVLVLPGIRTLREETYEALKTEAGNL